MVKIKEIANLDGAMYVLHVETDSFNEVIDGAVKYYFEQCLNLGFNKEEVYKALAMHKAMLTPDELQYLLNVLIRVEAEWGYETDLQEKLLRLMEIMENENA
jgi:hypothetical protein